MMDWHDDFDLPDWEELYGFNANSPGTWRTQAGVVMRISDMDDDHLLNTIRMLERRGIGRDECSALCYLYEEQESRGLAKKPL